MPLVTAALFNYQCFVEFVGFEVNVSLVSDFEVRKLVFVCSSIIVECTTVIDIRKNIFNSIISQPDETLICAGLRSHPG